jgi:hypothetical protein
MSRTGITVLIVGGVVALVGGVAYFSTAGLTTNLKPVLPPAPPPPPPSINQTIQQAGAAAVQLGVNAYDKLSGSKLTGKDVALTVATGGIYPQAKIAWHAITSIF